MVSNNNSKILLLDLHYTLAPEAEYGLAVEAAVDIFINAAKAQNKLSADFDADNFKSKVYKDIKKVHVNTQDDWDNRIFDYTNSKTLAKLGFTADEFEKLRVEAIEARANFSKNYVKDTIYTGVIDTIKAAREAGHTIYIVTDTNSSGAQPQVRNLGLDGLVDGVYCCSSAPSAIPDNLKLEHTPVFEYDFGSYKPDVKIVGDILLNYAKERGLVSDNLKFENVFEIAKNDAAQKAVDLPRFCNQKLVIKEGVYKELFTQLRSNTIGMGDDNRDHILFTNSGVFCVDAEYGRRKKNDEDKKGAKILKAICGWPKERLSLLGYFGKKNHLAKSLSKIVYTCKESISEITHLLQLSGTELTEIAKSQKTI